MNLRRTAKRHPGLKWALGAVEFAFIDVMLIAGLTPAWAAAISIPVAGTTYNINLGNWPDWIIALVAAGGFWKAWRAEQRATEAAKLGAANAQNLAAVGVKIDGMLADRDKAKVREGEEKERIVGADAATQLQKGVEQGIRQERESVAAANPVGLDKPLVTIHEKSPVPVTDKAADRAADALEKLADVTEKAEEKKS